MQKNITRNYRYLDLVMALFLTVLIVSNIASSAKIVDWGVSILGLPLAFDAGTILFPISYIFGDVLTEVYGLNSRAVSSGPGSAAWHSAPLYSGWCASCPAKPPGWHRRGRLPTTTFWAG